MRYILPGVQLETSLPLRSFRAFLSNKPSELPLVQLDVCHRYEKQEKHLYSVLHSGVNVIALEDGWLYFRSDREDYALRVSRDYARMTAHYPEGSDPEQILPLLRTALECASAAQGVISLHSACITLDDKAVCFSAVSGTGKSTRAQSWERALGAQFLSGDRPSIRVRPDSAIACGVPWDGKEQIFRNAEAPLRAICKISRGAFTRIRKFSPNQARRFLMQQCFIPMWDTDAAFLVMRQIDYLSKTAPIYKLICGPNESDAREAGVILYHRPDKIMEVEQDMKIKPGFVLRSAAGEHVVMPTGKNISQFDGAIILNDVAAFVWEKLTEGASAEELLEHILSEFEVSREQAKTDLDALIAKLRGYDVIEDETV